MKRKNVLKAYHIILSLFLLCSCNSKGVFYTTDNYDELSRQSFKAVDEEYVELEVKDNKRELSNENSIEVNEETDLSEIVENYSKLEIHYIDVGQGDATLIMCDEHYLLIDGGSSSCSPLMYTYLKNLNINYLDYVICTHPDDDHIGGISGALNYASLGHAYCPYIKESESYYDFVKYTEKYKVEIEKPNIGDTFSLGNAEIEIIATNIGGNNDASIITRINYFNNSFLFMGDAGFEVENYLINNYDDLKCDVLKVAHHGSEYSTSYQFLSACNPDYAVISVGKDNTYGHPTELVLNNLEETDVKTFRTDLQGDIIFTSDGNSISIKTEKNQLIDAFSNGSELKQPITRSMLSANSNEYTYCININSKKFHYSYCSSVDDMKEKNKKYTNDDRDSIIAQGYSPCKRCNP